MSTHQFLENPRPRMSLDPINSHQEPGKNQMVFSLELKCKFELKIWSQPFITGKFKLEVVITCKPRKISDCSGGN
uniref:Uncharacterized protein n=1 Tax=Arundo donax TaxID=35708 RepID=A0A0A9DTL9_ARUDO